MRGSPPCRARTSAPRRTCASPTPRHARSSRTVSRAWPAPSPSSSRPVDLRRGGLFQRAIDRRDGESEDDRVRVAPRLRGQACLLAQCREQRGAIPPVASGNLREQDAPVRAETDGSTVANGLELVGRDGHGGRENRDLDLELRKLVGVYREEAWITGCGRR